MRGARGTEDSASASKRRAMYWRYAPRCVPFSLPRHTLGASLVQAALFFFRVPKNLFLRVVVHNIKNPIEESIQSKTK